MHTFKSFIMLAAILASLLFTQSAKSQGLITSFHAGPRSLGSPTHLNSGGSFGNKRHSISDSTITGELDLDAMLQKNMTVAFSRVEFDIGDIELSGRLDSASGENVAVEGRIDFDPIIFTDHRHLETTLLPNGRFGIDGFNGRLGRTDQPDLTGSYAFSGPTETIEGTFSIDPTWERSGSISLDGANLPDGVEVKWFSNWRMGDYRISPDDRNIISDTIDGADISVRINDAYLFAPPHWEFENVAIAVPEPSTYAFVVGGCLIALIVFRRRRAVS